MARSRKSRKPRAKTRTESDAFGPLDIPADRLWGAQTQRSLHNFRIGSERMPIEIVRALGLIKRAAAEVNRDLGSLDRRRAGGHHQSRAGHRRRQARRAFPAAGLADRLRHADQHERQRSDRQRRQCRARQRIGREEAGTSERSRQYEPIVERFDPDRHAHRGGDRAARSFAAGPEGSAGRARQEDQRIRQDHQDRPHPHHGCDADHLGPGIFRLCRASEIGDCAARAGAARALSAGAGRHRGRHRAQFQAAIRQGFRPPHRHT